MEKQRPHYPLAPIRASVRERGAAVFTRTALEGGAAMGFAVSELVEIVCGLSGDCFYKSMTTLYDHKLWQDVYIASTPAGEAYIKVTGFLDGRPPVIQFKRR
ncbi:MAG: type II toxin-antitoxin system MqsR family toxin [Thermoanaerobaculia bacterium]